MREKTVAEVFGEIVWLMTRSAEHSTKRISTLETMVMPGVLLRQFKLYYQKDLPFAAIIYALVDDESYEKFASDRTKIGVDQWKSGKRFLEITAVAPFGEGNLLSADLEREINQSMIKTDE